MMLHVSVEPGPSLIDNLQRFCESLALRQGCQAHRSNCDLVLRRADVRMCAPLCPEHRSHERTSLCCVYACARRQKPEGHGARFLGKLLSLSDDREIFAQSTSMAGKICRAQAIQAATELLSIIVDGTIG